MANKSKMKLFQSGQKYLSILGVSPSESLINVKFVTVIFAKAIDISLNVIFPIFEASSFHEYTNSIFLTSTVTMVSVCFVLSVLKISNFFALIDLFEKCFERSEF